MSEVLHHQSSSQPRIHLTEASRQHVLAYLKKVQDKQGIRFSVKKTGCSGLSYVVDYIEKLSDDDIILPLDETYVVCIDKASYPYLNGMTVDYVRQGLNYKFMFTNPNQTGACGCGESFTIK